MGLKDSALIQPHFIVILKKWEETLVLLSVCWAPFLSLSSLCLTLP